MLKVIKEFNDLVGEQVTLVSHSEDNLTLFLSSGYVCTLWHEQDCCERVQIESIEGDLSLLTESPITMAIESTPDLPPPPIADSFTWTRYDLANDHCHIKLTWLGESNGYYSEDVHFAVKPPRSAQ